MIVPRHLVLAIGLGMLIGGTSALAQEQFLVNPGFESIDRDGSPKGWDNYVMPHDGAYAQLDVLSSEGSRSVMLHVPTAYDVDPANNWSQVVYGDFAGKTLTAFVDAYAEDGARPEVWLQCFRNAPLRVLAAADSSQSMDPEDFSSWTRLAVSVDAPAGTDFVVLRCVIEGAGTVWFDDASFTTNEDDALNAVAEIEPVEEPITPSVPTPVSELEEIRRQMQSALDELRDSNTRLRGQIATLETELQSFRDQMDSVNASAAQSPKESEYRNSDVDREPRHILLPREP